MLNLMMVMVVRVTFFPSLEFKDWMIWTSPFQGKDLRVILVL